MATADSLVADVQSYTEAGTTIPNANALECVNLALRRMQRKHDWYPMQVSIDLPIPGGTKNFAVLPFDFLHEVFVYTVDPSQNDPSLALVPIARLVKPQWFGSVDNLGNTDPIFPNIANPSLTAVVRDLRNYYVWGRTINIVPSPSQAITIRVDYAKRLPELQTGLTPSDQNDLTVLYPDVVRAGALVEAYYFLHEEERATGMTALYAERLAEAISADNSTAFAGAPAKRGT